MKASRGSEVLIVGAGPAGAATAWHLARAGIRVLLVDRARFPRDKPCSEYLSPEAVRLLDQLGVVEDLEAAGAAPLHGSTVHGPDGAALTGRFAAAPVAPFRATGLAVSRRILDARLLAAALAAGAEFREATLVDGPILESGAVTGAVLRAAGGPSEVIRARLTIGADGLHSRLARALGGRRHGRPARMAFVAHVAGLAGLDGLAAMHVGRDGYAGVNRITLATSGAPAIANVALVVPVERTRRAAGDPTRFFLETLEEFPGLRGRIRREALVRPVLVTGPFAARSQRVLCDGALLVGDAAEFFDPFTGDGIHAALKGASLASHAALIALATPGPVTARSLAGYRRARLSAFLGKWTIERVVGYGMLAPPLFDRALRRLALRDLGHTFVAATADYIPASAVLNPWFLCRMIL